MSDPSCSEEQTKVQFVGGEMSSPTPDDSSTNTEETRRLWLKPSSSTDQCQTPTSPSPVDATALLPVEPLNPQDVAFGFRLEAELGRGAFGNVYLAVQPELAGRKVVLKVSRSLSLESQALARLQHTNIVPVYSVHREGEYQAVCMPYFGAVTVAELLRRLRGRDHLPQTGSDFVNTFREATSETPARFTPSTLVPTQTPTTEDILLEKLASGSYIHACCWLIARLADGLEHAHERGFLHRDIKPANILLTDEGQPMLLDFGVAEEWHRRGSGEEIRIGGTIPYMAPEQIAEYDDHTIRADRRSDVYSLGIVLCELLTGRYPFEDHSGSHDYREIRESRVHDRPNLKQWNPAITPGLESIIHCCLAFDPQRRYATAGALRDDLERYLTHQKMLVAPEKSLIERGSKWMARNRWAKSHVTISMLALCLIAVLAVGLFLRHLRIENFEAVNARERLKQSSRDAQQVLFNDPVDPELLEETLENLQIALATYGIPDDDQWERGSKFSRISPENRDALRQELLDACLLTGRAHGMLFKSDPKQRTQLDQAIRMNAWAEKVGGADGPRSLYGQRAKLMALAERPREAEEILTKAKTTKLQTARDYYLAGDDAFSAKQYTESLDLFRKSREIDPALYWAHYGEGICCNLLKKWADARTAFHAAVALQPQSAMAVFCRGQAAMMLRDYASAETDFTMALERQPDMVQAFIARAEARLAQSNPNGAKDDIDRAGSLNANLPEYTIVRNRVLEKLGDADIGLLPPKTADDWINRGLSVLATDLAKAGECFEKAVLVEPQNATPCIYAAHVCERQNRLDDARNHLSRAVELNPAEFRAWLGRGLIHARQKKIDQAIQDARTALEKNVSAPCLFQVACIFGVVAKEKPEYAAEAVTYLGIALRGGAGINEFQRVKEFDSIRSMPEFKRLLLEHKPTK